MISFINTRPVLSCFILFAALLLVQVSKGLVWLFL